MALKPNTPDPSVPAARRATNRINNQEVTVLADDLQVNESHEFKPPCATCNGTNAERVTIPNAVIMDALLAPVDGLDGEPLADVVMNDERITARTALDPKPRKSKKLGRQHVMARAVDMTNARLIPFSPFGAFVNQDRMRDRPIFAEWSERYLAELPDSSTFEPGTPQTFEPETEPPADEPDAGDAAIAALDQLDTDPADSYPAGEDVGTVTVWIGTDKARAQYALDLEESRSRPRKTVLQHAYGTLGADVNPVT